MSETLEQRIRRHAIESRDDLVGFFAGDIVELLDERDNRITQLEQAAQEVVKRRDVGELLKSIDALAALLEKE